MCRGRGALRRRSWGAGQGRRPGLRPPIRVGALRGRGGGGPARLRHPGRVRELACPDPDVELRGRDAGGRGRHRDHRQPQPVDRQRLQGQVADRGRRRTGAAGGPRADDRRQRRRGDPAAAVRRCRGRGPGRALRPVPRLRAVRPAHGRRRRAQGGRRVDPRGPDVGRRGGLDQPPAGGGEDPGHGAAHGAQPVLRRRQPGADPAEHRRGARDRGGRRLRPGVAPRRRRGPGRRDRRARDVHPPAPGLRAAHVLPGRASGVPRPGGQERQRDLAGRAPRRALRDRRPRDPGRLQVRRSRR